jgi:hypothetical protein
MSTHNQSQSNTSRFGFKWNVNECLRLQREFELLKLSVPEIAALHGRTIKAIMYKIDLEGFATFNDLYIQTYGQFNEHVQEEQVLHLVPADLESGSESEDDNDNDNDDDFIPNESDDDDDDYDSESSDEDDGSNKHYLYSQVKRMQKQITAILGYLSKGATAAAATEEASIEAYGSI